MALKDIPVITEQTFTQLTAPGASDAAGTNRIRGHVFQVTVAAIDTNVVVQAEGSVDGTNYMIMPLESTVVSGLAITNHVATITANGTYLLYVKGVNVQKARLKFVSETGGTAATIDVKYRGSS